MNKLLIIAALAVTVAGCGKFDRTVAGWTGDATKTCVDGVTYLQFTSGAAVQVDLTGKPVACVRK